jgi:hypothetical protein
MINHRIEHHCLDTIAVSLEVGGSVYGPVGTGIRDQTLVWAQRLPDTLDIRGCVDR